MKTRFRNALVGGLLASLLAAPAAAVELVDTITVEHPHVPVGRSISIVIRHDQGRVPLATLLRFRSTTILYTIDFSSHFAISVRAYNIGPFVQEGEVTVGFWE